MADNVAITAGSGTSIAADDITSVFYQRVKISQGADGAATDTSTTVPFPVRPVPKFVTVSMSTPTGALAAGDVYAATQVVAACTHGDDIPAILQSVTVIDSDDQKATLRIVVFDANTSLGAEDAAPDIDDTEVLTVQGHITVNASDYVDLGGASYVHISNLGLAVKPASGTDDIYIAIYGHSTSTPTYASGVLTVRLGFI